MLDALTPPVVLDLKEKLGCTPNSSGQAAANAAKIQAALNDTSRKYAITGGAGEYFFTSLTFPKFTGHSICGPPGGTGRSYLLGTGDYGAGHFGGPSLRLTSTLGSGHGSAITMSGHGGGLENVVLNGRPMASYASFQGTRVDAMIEVTGEVNPPSGKMQFKSLTINEATVPIYFSSNGDGATHADSCTVENYCFQGFATGCVIDNVNAVCLFFRDGEVLGDSGAALFKQLNGGDLFVDNLQMNYFSSLLFEPHGYSQNASVFSFRNLRFDTPSSSSQTIKLVDYTNASAGLCPRIDIQAHIAGFPNSYAALGGVDFSNQYDARSMLVGADGKKDAATRIILFPLENPHSASFAGNMSQYHPGRTPLEQSAYVQTNWPGCPDDLFSAGGFRTLAAAGSSKTDAALVLHPANKLTTSGSGKGVILPPGPGAVYYTSNDRYCPYRTGTWTFRNTDGTNAVKIYPPAGKQIDDAGADVAFSLALHKSVMLIADGESGNFYSILGG